MDGVPRHQNQSTSAAARPPSSLVPTITPASLSSLAIYNPSLGATDETVQDQVVLFTSRKGRKTAENDRLRQVGLAQGIVEFAKGFAQSHGYTAVETQKARLIVLQAEEPGWWFLVTIDLTCVRNPSVQPPSVEYSSREIAPVQLLVAQIRTAYTQFRFRYGLLQDNWTKLSRQAFSRRLEKYWQRWAWNRWDIMLRGSPVVDLFSENYIKMAGGKRGKELGPQEREFLEGWAQKERKHGLVDMVVLRLTHRGRDSGDRTDKAGAATPKGSSGLWFWRSPDLEPSPDSPNTGGAHPAVSTGDGCIFRGIGSISPQSMADVANYITELHEAGGGSRAAQRVGQQTRPRRKRGGMDPPHKGSEDHSPTKSVTGLHQAPQSQGKLGNTPETTTLTELDPRPIEAEGPREDPDATQDIITRPIGTRDVGEAEVAISELDPSPLPQAESGSPEAANQQNYEVASANPGAVINIASLRNTNAKIMKFLTLGWGSQGRIHPAPASDGGDSGRVTENEGESVGELTKQRGSRSNSYFIIGFQGDLDLEDLDDDMETDAGRISTRTIWAACNACSNAERIQSEGSGPDERLREHKLVVYKNTNLVFALILENESPCLLSPSFYRSLHHQLSPYASSVLSASSTDASLGTPSTKAAYVPPFDLFLDSNTGSLYSTMPFIPQFSREVPGWSRAEAIHMYIIILSMLAATNTDRAIQRRSARSTKGWWVSWSRWSGGEGIVVRRAGGAGIAAGSSADVKNYFETVEGKTKAQR